MKQPRERLPQMCGNPACNPAKRATALVKIIDDKYILEESNKLQAYRASAKAVKWNENESVVGLHRTSWNPLDTRRINRSTCTGCPRCAHTQVLSAARSKVDCLRHRGMQHIDSEGRPQRTNRQWNTDIVVIALKGDTP